MPSRCAWLPSRRRVTWPSWVSIPSPSQRSSAAPSGSATPLGVLGDQRRASSASRRPRRARRPSVAASSLLERAALLRIDALGLEIDHRFGLRRRRRPAGQRRSSRPVGVAPRRAAPGGPARRSPGLARRPSAAIESTRNGMSRLTTAMRVQRRVAARAERDQQRRLAFGRARARLRAGRRRPRRAGSATASARRAAANRPSARAALRRACARRPTVRRPSSCRRAVAMRVSRRPCAGQRPGRSARSCAALTANRRRGARPKLVSYETACIGQLAASAGARRDRKSRPRR